MVRDDERMELRQSVGTVVGGLGRGTDTSLLARYMFNTEITSSSRTASPNFGSILIIATRTCMIVTEGICSRIPKQVRECHGSRSIPRDRDTDR